MDAEQLAADLDLDIDALAQRAADNLDHGRARAARRLPDLEGFENVDLGDVHNELKRRL